MKKLRITVDGKEFEVTVEILGEEEPQAPRARGSKPPVSASARVVAPAASAPAKPAPKPAPVAGSGSVASPLAGKVVAVDVQAGQSVSEGDNLITLEAMKMNTFVTAPHAGTVGSVNVSVGDPVEEGQELLTLS